MLDRLRGHGMRSGFGRFNSSLIIGVCRSSKRPEEFKEGRADWEVLIA